MPTPLSTPFTPVGGAQRPRLSGVEPIVPGLKSGPGSLEEATDSRELCERGHRSGALYGHS